MGLNIECKTIKNKKKTQGNIFVVLELEAEFLELTPKAQFIKGKIYKLGFVKFEKIML